MDLDGNPLDSITWTDFSMLYEMKATRKGRPVEFTQGNVGTTMFIQYGLMDGRWMGFLAGLGMPRPGKCEMFFVAMVLDREGDKAANKEFVDRVLAFERQFIVEDLSILTTIRFRPGTPSGSDGVLLRYLSFLRNYPRAHPAADYLR
ncbi:hypothetical protein [Kribbella ginsengisoli]|uniref:Uncharacterized protein n=1 Tax=Kribbella ginsengisoli TaxID=363865 RepID=A0ABP6Z4S1_9ACTN